MAQNKDPESMKQVILDIFVGAIFDLLPLSLILLIHTVNFR